MRDALCNVRPLTVNELWIRLTECLHVIQLEQRADTEPIESQFEQLLGWYNTITGEHPPDPDQLFVQSNELNLSYGRIAQLLFERMEQRLWELGVDRATEYYRTLTRLVVLIAAYDGDLADQYIEAYNQLAAESRC